LVWSKACSFIYIFGDLLQFLPVHKDPAFIHLSDEKFRKYLGSLSATNLWTTLFDYDEMRSQGDGSYRKLLSRIRVDLLTKFDWEILEKKKIFFKNKYFEARVNELCDFINKSSSDTVCLLPTCHMCDVFNIAMLNCIASK